MPFGCLVPRESGKSSNLSDITDKYELGQILKAKEFCELCLARERQSGQLFICKKFLKKDGRKVRRAAKNEILILQKLSHPNILQLMDTYETRKEYFIIQEIATGGDLFDWILDQGSYTERDAANVIRQVLEAVAYLHSLNIVHRNLKLENLMYYTENNQSKVVLRDFYLSTFENGSITEPCGTPEYLAPEVVTRHRYGRPVDCWAVGVIMYILLSGNPPFFDEAEEENTDLHHRIIFCRIAAGEFEFDSPYWDDISAAAKALVCRLMEVDQMLRITAPEALGHEWMTGQVASERNLKDVVCAQFERNFARSKWRKALCVTTFMQRLRTQDSEPRSPGGGERGHAEPQGAGKESAQGADGEVGEMRSRSERGVNRPAPLLSPGAECPAVSTGGAPSPAAPERQGRRGGEQPRSGARGRAEWEEQEELEEREELEEQEEWEEQACGSAAGRRPSASSVGSSPSSAPCLAATGATAPPAGQHEAAQQQGREGGGRGERVSGCQIPAGAAEGRAERGNGGSGGGVSHELGQPGRRQGEVHCGWEESAGTPPVAQEQTEAPLPESHCPSSRSPAGSPGGVQRRVSPGGVQRRGSPGGVQRRVSPGGVQRRDSPGGVQRRGSPGGVQRRGSPGGVQRRDHMTEQTETQTLEKMEEDSPPMLEQRDNQNSCQTICPPLPTMARPSPPPHLQTFSQEGQDGLGDVVRPCRGALSPSGGQSGSGL